jgi:hypothetical protein
VRAERTVIGTHRSSCVASLRVVVVEREAVWRTCDTVRKEEKRKERKKKSTRPREDGAPTRKTIPFRAWLRGDPYLAMLGEQH